MEARLHGRAATESLCLYARLGAAGARFDARAVARAVLTAKGRRHLSIAIRQAFVGRSFRPVPRPSRRARRSGISLAASVAGAGGDGSRPRPADDAELAGEYPPFPNGWRLDGV